MTTNTGTFKDHPPKSYDGTVEDWLELSYSAQYYHYNKEPQKEYNRQYKDRVRSWFREYKSNLSCQHCGEGHPAVLDFHHVGEKNHRVANMVRDGHSIESIKKEIDKCEVLCANCHRKEHAEDAWSNR